MNPGDKEIQKAWIDLVEVVQTLDILINGSNF